ncbi:MAG: sortase [Anaerolineae bacterium]|nr:sortase [Anaerolineae bacterium]
MYRQQRGGGATFLIVIVLGLVAGIGYLAYDSGLFAPQTSIAVTPTVEPTGSPLLAAPAITPSAAPQIAAEITQGARFYAPTAGIASSVIEAYLNGTSWDVAELGFSIGHLQGTAWLNVPGNIVLAGHVEMADGRAGIFARLNSLNIGDPVTLSQAGEERTYQVTQKFETAPDDLAVLYPSQSEQLTLITCSNYDFLKDTYATRYVVIAERVA